jgi:hypothetical protein
MYWLKRKIRQIKNVLRWLPIIWKQFDFDYRYSIEVFSFQLQKQAEFLESDRACTMDAKVRASRIRTIIRLMDKVYEEEYACEYQDELTRRYGNRSHKFVKLDRTSFNPVTNTEEGLYEMQSEWDNNYSEEELKEIDRVERELFEKSIAKQERAHKLLWQLIEKDIRTWWD